MKLRTILVFLVAVITSLQGVGLFSSPLARKGVLDLRNLQDKEKFSVYLNGEWEFYWNKMLHPHDFSGTPKYKPDFYGDVPSYWTNYPSDSVKTTGKGYATYRLTVLLPPGFRKPMAFDMPVFDSSYDIYINGQYMGGNGTTGKSEQESVPWYEKIFFKFNPTTDSISIIINVSNFHHRRGGFWLPMRTGTFHEVQKKCAASWACDWCIISILLGFSLFFMFFYIIYPREPSMAFFSMAATGLGLRPLFTSNFLILSLMQPEWIWIIRFEYLSLFLALTGWYWFTGILYPSRSFRIFTWFITIISSVLSLSTLFLPVKIFSYSTFFTYPALFFLLFYALYGNVKGILNNNKADFIYFSAFVLLSIGVVHDVKVSLGQSAGSSDYYLSYFLTLFVFIQAASLLYKWVHVLKEKERLHLELDDINKNMGLLVQERTQEINSRKEEIEHQNIKIASQNRRLSETIQLKNKIFSVIAHDLRSPVVNILYMLNLLKEEENKERSVEFANASIQYAQQVINLLENMLVWGRGQEDKIKFSPETRDLADLILTNLSIFKESADKKGISVNFTQIGNSKAYFDKDLFDIVIRNLLSNAVKFTNRGGRISILLKDKSRSGEGIIVKVCDNGIGMSRTRQEKLFTSDEVISTPGTGDEKGTGLGLKLCYELIRINNSTITVDSREGEGTCFAITLPVKE